MNKNSKQAPISKSQKKDKTPTFRVQTSLRVGRAAAGAAFRERLRSRFNLPTI